MKGKQRRAEKKKPLPASLPPVHVTFAEALRLHQAGHLADAEKLYRQVLLAVPRHANSLHLLGVLAFQVGRHDSAVDLIGKAIALKDNEPAYHSNLGAALRDQGKFDEAVASYDRALALKADFADAHSNRGNALRGQGKFDEAVASYDRALAIKPDFAEAHYNRGIALQDQGKLAEAVASYDRALTIKPGHAEAHRNKGNAFQGQGKLDEAVTSYDRAIAIKPDFTEAYSNRGNALRDQGKLDEALVSYDRALAIKPDFAEAHYNRGVALQDQSNPDEAAASYDRAIAIKPDFVAAHSNRGNALRDQGKLDEAVASYDRALAIKPDYAEALNNLSLAMIVQGKAVAALNLIRRSLLVKESPEAKGLFVACIKRLRGMHNDEKIRDFTIRALTEPWGRAGDLAGHVIDLIKGTPDVASCVARAADASPTRLSAQDLFGANGPNTLAADPLLIALLESTPVSDIDIEHFLTTARRAMLEDAVEARSSASGTNTTSRFYIALARQCFVNEYVFSSTEEEQKKASNLRDSLVASVEATTEVPVIWLTAVASYYPLWSLPHSTRLLEREWPADIMALLTQQIREPMEELEIRATIPQLTDIEDEVSLGVQKQYEENPYPRWIKAAPEAKLTNIEAYFSRTFPLARIERHVVNSRNEILIAGCGTGQHSIGTAQRFPAAHVLAIDLSMSSLAYAKRKTRELGLTSIDYAQANLLKLGSLGRSFDVIESSGVLHHLEDPWAGWRVLLSILRPGGFMRLGLYSALARQRIVQIRRFIAEQGYGTTASEIRRCRQHLVALGQSSDPKPPLASPDFYTISSCRDLLFHVQEHQVTLADIELFLRENDLTFLGFETGADVLGAYRQRLPNDRAGTNLSQWQIFEMENPYTFAGMYQFWIQKAA